METNPTEIIIVASSVLTGVAVVGGVIYKISVATKWKGDDKIGLIGKQVKEYCKQVLSVFKLNGNNNNSGDGGAE